MSRGVPGGYPDGEAGLPGPAELPDAEPPAEATRPAEITDVLVADLDDLAAELIGDSLSAISLSMLRRDLRLAVRSTLGFTITSTVHGPGISVAVNVVDEPLHPGDAVDSLTVPLPTMGDGSTMSITIYAAEPHSLDDLRDRFADAFDLPPSSLSRTLAHLDPLPPGITGLEAFSEAHRAVGVLLSAGHTLETAGIELIRLAHTRQDGIRGAAQALLSTPTEGRAQP